MIVTPLDIAVDKYINLHRAVSARRTVEYYKDILEMFEEYAAEQGCIYVSKRHFITYPKIQTYMCTLICSGIHLRQAS